MLSSVARCYVFSLYSFAISKIAYATPRWLGVFAPAGQASFASRGTRFLVPRVPTRSPLGASFYSARYS